MNCCGASSHEPKQNNNLSLSEEPESKDSALKKVAVMPIHLHALYSKITEYIYIGTNECCQTKRFVKELLRKRIEADISLEEIRIDAPFGVKYYLWLPVKDHTAPTPLQFQIGVAIIDQLVKAKKKIYIHCEKGHGRAPTLVVAYLMTKGMELGKAIDFLKSKRPGVYIHPKQMIDLKNFQKYV